MIEAIIFDMDGVIVDSEKLKGNSWSEIFKKYNVPVQGNQWYRERIGRHGRELCAEAIETFRIPKDVDELFKEQVNCSKRLESYSEVIPSTISFIKSLNGSYRLGVASSNYRDVIEDHLRRNDILNYFNVVTSGVEEVKRNKPSPDIYLLTAKKLNIDPGKSLGIEDTSAEIEAVKSAGMKCIGFINFNSGNQDLSKADITTDNLLKLSLGAL